MAPVACLRVDPEEELQGLDILEHGAPGYGEGFGSFAGVSTGAGSSTTSPRVGSTVSH